MMDSLDPSDDDAMLRAAIEASLREAQTRDNPGQPVETSSRAAQGQCVDLTQDSDIDSDVQEVFPKSKSVVSSDTDNEAHVASNEVPKEATSRPIVNQTIDVDAEDDSILDEDLELAIALSLGATDRDPRVTDNPVLADSQKSTENSRKTLQGPTGILGMDRKKMEEERIARQIKRKADDFVPETNDLGNDQHRADRTSLSGAQLSEPSHPPTKVRKIDPDPQSNPESREPLPKARKSDSALESGGGESSSFSVSSSRTASNPNICGRPDSNHYDCNIKPFARSMAQFPLGAVKRTAIGRAARSKDDITIEEVLQRGDLELAVLSSFLWDMEWLFTKMDTFNTRFILMMHAKEQSTRIQYQEETASMSNLRLCFPPMEGQINCMHSKLMLLFHPTYMRIAIPTANLTATDWGENNLMENTVFVIDLPKKGTEPGFCNDSKTSFYEELVYFLKASTLNDNIIKKLENFDFSKTARYAFVHTIGGIHSTERAWRRTGYPGLGRAVTNLGLRTTAPVNIDYVTSSVGSLNEKFVRAMHYACKGDDGLSEYILRTEKNPILAQTDDSDRGHMLTAHARDEWKEHARVYFPSDLTVRSAHAYPENTAGTICFQKKWWKGAAFPQGILRDCEGVRDKRILMHNKLIFVWPQQDIILRDNTKCTAWVYVGSANFSESAWGRLVKDQTTKEPRLNCRNWECGVIVPVTSPYEDIPQPETKLGMPARAQPERVNHNAQEKKFPIADINAFVPVPMKVPAKAYLENNSPALSDQMRDFATSSNERATGLDSSSGKQRLLEPWFFMG